MKKKYLILDFIEFSLIIFIFVVPSFLVEQQNMVILDVNYPLMPILIRFCVMIYVLIRMFDTGIMHRAKVFSYKILVQYFFQSIKIYAILVITTLLFNALSKKMQYFSPEIISNPPETLIYWVWFIFSVVTLACFEEIIFRQFLPERMLQYLEKCSTSKVMPQKTKFTLQILIELLFIVLFAMGHIYLGILAILAALISGILFRISVKKMRSIVPACIAHSINNIISFIAVFYLL